MREFKPTPPRGGLRVLKDKYPGFKGKCVNEIIGNECVEVKVRAPFWKSWECAERRASRTSACRNSLVPIV